MKIEDLDTPVLLVDADAFERNVARMAKLCADAGVACRPHAKAHKSPQVARIQMDAGVVGMCCAKLGEAEVMAAAGIEDLHITTPVVGAVQGHAADRGRPAVAGLGGRRRCGQYLRPRGGRADRGAEARRSCGGRCRPGPLRRSARPPRGRARAADRRPPVAPLSRPPGLSGPDPDAGGHRGAPRRREPRRWRRPSSRPVWCARPGWTSRC